MRILILGGGFAGRAAARQLGKTFNGNQQVDILLIDKNQYTTMMPSLPDLAGGRVNPKSLVEDIEVLIPKKVEFKKTNVINVDLQHRLVQTTSGDLPYDYLILASGSKTNFFGCEETFKQAYKMDCFEDAIRIRDAATKALLGASPVNFVVSGGGFTGLELATNLYHQAKTLGKKANIYVVELADHVLPMLKTDMSRYVQSKIESLGIEFMLSSEVVSYDNNTVTLKNGQQIENAFFCWSAGVMNAVPVTGDVEALRDQRLVVDKALRLHNYPEVFVAGDSAAIKDKNGAFIRRAVNYAAMSGAHAGKNLAKVIRNEKPLDFHPIDLGWVIPLYVSSIGVGLGVGIKGRLGITFHYLMCGIKNYSVPNFLQYVVYGIKFFFTTGRKLG